MNIIITYDSKISNKLHKILKRYLIWYQNSVFKGELTETKYLELINILKDKILDNDSITIFTTKYEEINIYDIGIKKYYDDNFI